MSVMLSHIEFDSQNITENDEEEMEKEDAKQQLEIREFLQNELNDDDLLDETFNSNFTQSNHENNHATNHATYNNNVLPQQPNNHVQPNYFFNNNQNKNIREIPTTSQFDTENNFMTQDNNFMTQENNNFLSPSYFGLNQFDNANTEAYHQSEVPPGHQRDPLDVSNNSFGNSLVLQPSVPQVQILYEARGRRIAELQNELQTKEDELAKGKRVSQHKLNMLTNEKEGLQTSTTQLQNLLQQHKQELGLFEQKFNMQQDKNEELNQRVNELNEKLYVSDSTISALQHQLNELSKSDSLGKARLQHENILATLREKHKNEILNLNEKLDDMKQTLAWKTEDVNRYKEMLNTNSSASEIGMLRSRLSSEERRTKEVEEKLDVALKDNRELAEQVKVLESLVKDERHFTSSTPFVTAATTITNQRKKLDFKTPISSKYDSSVVTPPSGDTAMRKELVKALSLNREKRQEILVLREQIDELRRLGKNKYSTDNNVSNSIHNSMELLQEECEKCHLLEQKLQKNCNEISQIKNENELLQVNKTELTNDLNELKTNMAEMIKTFDDEKTKLSNQQNSAVLRMIDDSKQLIKKELNDMHEKEVAVLQNEIQQLNSDVFHAKEEYIKLSKELKLTVESLSKEFEDKAKTELDVLTLELENKHDSANKKLISQLTQQHLDDKEKDKTNIYETLNIEYKQKLEHDLTLAKVELLNDFEEKKRRDIETAVQFAKSNWKCNCKEDNNAKDEIDKANMLNKVIDLEKQLELSSKTVDVFTEKEKQWLVKEAELKHQLSQNDSNTSQTALIFDDIINNTKKKEICKQCQFLKEKLSLLEKECKERKVEVRSLLNQSAELHDTLQNKSFEADQNKSLNSSRISNLKDSHGLEKSCYFSPETNRQFDSLLESKLKLWTIKEQTLNSEIVKLTNSLNVWKERYETIEVQLKETRNENVELRNKQLECETQIGELTMQVKTSYQKLEEHIKENESTKKQLTKHYETLIKEAILNEQKKSQDESAKLKEEALKVENNFMKAHLLTDLQNNVNTTQELDSLKLHYDGKIQELKQGFREKLTQINEMKKQWIVDENGKREKLKQMMSTQYSQQLLQVQNESQKSLQTHFQKWQVKKEEQDKVLVNLEEELKNVNEKYEKMEDEFKKVEKELENEKDRMLTEQEKQKKSIHDLLIQHNNAIELIKRQHQVQLAAEKENLKIELEENFLKKLHKVEVEGETKIKEAYQNEVLKSKENTDSIEKIRQLYLQTLNEINSDVMNHIEVTKQQAATQMKDAVQRERTRLLKKLKSKRKSDKCSDSDELKSNDGINNKIKTITQHNSPLIPSNKNDDSGPLTKEIFDFPVKHGTYFNNRVVNGLLKDSSQDYKASSSVEHFNDSLVDKSRQSSCNGNSSLEYTLLTSLCELPVSLKKTPRKKGEGLS